MFVIHCGCSSATAPGHYPPGRSQLRASRLASTTIDTFFGMNVKHRGCFEFGLILLRMNAVHRACIDASRILGADARFTNNVCHRISLGVLVPETKNKTEIIHCTSVKSTGSCANRQFPPFSHKCFQAFAESIRLRTFPVGVRGKSATTSKYFGTL